jgi:hypothetical protein
MISLIIETFVTGVRGKSKSSFILNEVISHGFYEAVKIKCMGNLRQQLLNDRGQLFISQGEPRHLTLVGMLIHVK